MSEEEHDNWSSAGLKLGRKFMSVFDIDGQLVVGKVEDSVDVCSQGGGGAVANPATKQVADIPVYLCAVLPGGNIASINEALQNGHRNSSGWYVEFDSRGIRGSSALPTSLPTSSVFWLPLLAYVVMAALP